MASLLQVVETQDNRSEFRDYLKETRLYLWFEGKPLQAMRVGKVLRKKKLFDAVLKESATQATAVLGTHTMADGELFKWFLEWLQDGGWEFILKIIKDIIDIML